MKEPLVSVKPKRCCLPLDRRIQLCNEVLRLRKEGLSYDDIVETIYRLNGVRLYRGTISFWVRGIKTPLGRANKFEAKPSPALAYVIGVRLGDGYSYKHGSTCDIALKTIDYEFGAETGRCLAKLLERDEPYRPRWDKKYLRWHVCGCSVLLHEFLRQPWQKLIPYIEANKTCVAFFLRGFFDSEGSIDGRALKVYNTDKDLLLYIQRLLSQYFGIEATGPHRNTKAGHLIRSPYNGKIYKTRRQCYKLYIRTRNLPLFHRYIGFTIRRKQLRLIEAVRK